VAVINVAELSHLTLNSQHGSPQEFGGGATKVLKVKVSFFYSTPYSGSAATSRAVQS